MGRAPCCDKANVKKGPWSPEEDAKLKEFIEKYGTGGNWIALPQKAGLKRCGKSCRLRWLNYLRPNIRHGEFSDAEDRVICTLYANIGSRWSIIAAQLPGRTDNDIKNYWNTKLKKKLMAMAVTSNQRKPPPFQSPLQAIPSQSPTFSSAPPLYREFSSYNYTPSKSLTGLEPLSITPNLWNTNNGNNSFVTSYSVLQSPEGLVSPMQYYPVKDNLLMFGGTEASCSSSDGSCSQISYGKEIKQEDMGALHSYYLSNGLVENQKFMLDYGSNNEVGDHPSAWTDQNPNGYFGNSQLQYDLEQVKQLISSTNGCNNSFFFSDENKTQERPMYYH
ncbi:unnamed protein product [Ilex paraguariensis]|uniref:Transcription factor RAX2 n=1 Tax=Ilex paraguariensis TaxID=185542 RepID=A0ABC8V1N7_9AQUA